MLLSMQKVKEIYSISRRTLINWEKEGLITPLRTPKGRRRYRKEDIEKLLGMIEEKPKPTVVLYARVSTKKQEEYLKNQIRRLEECANFQGWQYEVISEIASGVNENRRGLLKLLNKIKRGEVEKVVIEYPDRLVRFGFEYLKFFMESFGVELIVLNGEENKEDVNKELAEDLIAIVTSFAARIYGQRGSKKYDSNTG
ncbi:MAG: Resolvase, N-terminal domain [Caldanaerobacter subterraneus]|uniref:IS607 family transposase n=1 Tax=unclassified Thermoanaerobacter TaxID=2636821 RepID=UPI0000E1E181|nr:IS607 family transposase [Thermoanaerobacter sp. X514]KUJ91634.1 MAG: Resolvase domain-containing protein [Thermoanaerobacter thermocopriae]KUK34218.1 MAG: Resolvase, N-terminal domain [Caldanaerobacter subterraneus]HAA64233.1 IS607 family transposase [Thermoanaerobacter sp.]ABY92369.1 Resolvase, N-terminal domain [Thermoanaerobacter sp. X514]HCD10425.1 IS607 family transposase [Thermoanaerobacter sp.]